MIKTILKNFIENNKQQFENTTIHIEIPENETGKAIVVISENGKVSQKIKVAEKQPIPLYFIVKQFMQ